MTITLRAHMFRLVQSPLRVRTVTLLNSRQKQKECVAQMEKLNYPHLATRHFARAKYRRFQTFPSQHPQIQLVPPNDILRRTYRRRSLHAHFQSQRPDLS
jgi:hypothetical protein